MSSRLIAVQIIEQVVEDKITLTQVLHNNASFTQAGSAKALIQEISYGTFRWYIQLEYLLNQLLEKRIKKKDNRLKYLMLVGLYQLRYMRIPAHAVVSETVNACKKIKMEWAKGLVNAILRRYIREAAVLDPLQSSDDSLRTAHPAWLIEKLKQDWPDVWESIVEAGNQHPPMYLRVNQLRQNREQYLTQMLRAGMRGQITPYAIQGIRLEQPIDVNQLPGFASGDVSVQELAAQLAVTLLDLRPGQTVLDACAAPGGKSAHILESQPKLKSLTAIEKDANRAKRLFDNLKRLDLTAIIKVADIINIEAWWDNEKYDRILCDAPCTATGVIRRHPDIKYLRTPAAADAICIIQRQLLTTLWQTLKPKGLLVYATCSILKQENVDVIKNFMKDHDDCLLKSIPATWGTDTGYGRQILPGQDNMDGFFYACLIKE